MKRVVAGQYGETAIDTVETQRARELGTLSRSLAMSLSPDERLDILLQVKWVIQVCPLFFITVNAWTS